MPWFKVDDAFHGHPKVMELSPAAVGIWTLAGSWCANYLTDGEIKLPIARRLGATDEMIRELVDAELWIDVGGAYQFKDWAEYQPLKEEVMAERNAARDRMKAVRAKKKGVERSPEQLTNVQPNNTGTFGGTSPDVRVTPTLSLSLSQSPLLPDLEERETGRKTALPKSWAPNAAHIERAKEQGVDVIEQAEFFRLHAATHGRLCVSWNAAFTTWLKRAKPSQAATIKPAASSPWSKDFHK